MTGIGNMGFHMAGNVRKGMPPTQTLHIFDVNPASCQRFKDEFQEFGPIISCDSPKNVANKSRTVLSMVPDGKIVKQVYLDPAQGIIAATEDKERLLLECSTIEIATTQQVGKEIMNAGRGIYVDTPVSGGTAGAQAGTLSFFLGYPSDQSSDQLAQRIWKVINLMGATERINFCGALGTGLVCKIANNYAGLSNLVVAAQAMALGVRHGVDRKTLYQCIRGSSGGSWILDNAHPAPGVIEKAPSSNGFRQTFAPRLCVKDVLLGIEAAKDIGVDPTMGEEALKIFRLTNEDSRTAVCCLPLSVPSIWMDS